jgi:flagellar basal-body rod protein FlgG
MLPARCSSPRHAAVERNDSAPAPGARSPDSGPAMSHRSFVCALPFVVFAACQTAVPPAVDASFARRDAALASATMPVDAVLLQLVRARAAVNEAHLRVAAENLANVDSPGWKRRFVRATTQSIAASDGTVHSLPIVLGVASEFTNGAIEITARSLDVAIDGDGFFAVVRPDGSTGYTRAGQFAVDADGKLVDGRGQRVTPEITIPSDTLEIAIAPDGQFTVRTAGSPDTATLLGQLTLHRFVNAAGLRLDDACWSATGASGAPMSNTPGCTGLGLLKQGCLERSNVETARESLELQVRAKQQQAIAAALQQLGLVAP